MIFLRFRLILLGTVVLVVGGLAMETGLNTIRARERVIAEAVRQSQNIASTLEVQAGAAFRSTEVALMSIADVLALRSGGGDARGESVEALLQRWLGPHAAYRNLVIADAGGQVIHDAVALPGPLSVADRGYFIAHRDRADQGTYISQPLESRAGRGRFVAVSRRLDDAQGRFAGIVWAVVDLDRFERFYASLSLGANGAAMLWDRQGRAIVRHPATEVDQFGIGRFSTQLPAVTSGVRSVTLHGVSEIDGKERVSTIRAVDGFPLSVGVRLMASDYLASWVSGVWQSVIEMLGLGLLAATLTWLLLRYLGRLETTARALNDSERRARAIFDSSFQAMSMLAPDGTLLDINRAGLALSALPAETLVGRRVWEAAPWNDQPVWNSRLCDAVQRAARGESVRVEATVSIQGSRRTLDLSIKPVRGEDGRVAQLVSEARDITQRKEIEDGLRRSEARLRSYLDAAMEGILVADGTSHYVDVNPAASQILGYARGELLGMPMDALVPEGHRLAEATRAGLAAMLLSGGWRGEVALRHKDGRVLLCELSAVRLDGGHYLTVVRDVTERALAAERLAQAKDQAESASRTKSAFLATMSHELRTPLNAIIGFSELMMHEVFGAMGNPRYVDYARHIQQSGTHLLELINDVLDMSKLEAGRYTLDERPVDLAEVLESCLALGSVPADQGQVTLKSIIPAGLPFLLGDERAVRQVVLNLLSNAVKFTPENGQVTLEAGLDSAGDLTVTVSDTGIGIEAGALGRITEPFQQADTSIARRFGGTGLGLAISRSLMELHGGTLDFASTVGEGTLVTMRFPAFRVLAAPSAPPPALDIAGTAVSGAG